MDRSRASTLPRRKSSAETSVGLFVKAHEQKKLSQANQSYSMTHVQQSEENLNEYLHEEFVDDEDRIAYDAFATLPKASTTTTTILNDDFDPTATQTLPRSHKIKSDRTVTAMQSNFSPKARSMSVGELSLENRERGRVQLVVSSDSFVSCTLPRPPKPIRSVLTVQEKLTHEISSLPPQAEVYINLLDDEEYSDYSDSDDRYDSLSNSFDQNQVHSDVETESTLSTIHSRHVTPSQSKHTTPRSSFAKADRQHFDLAKLLDPFEKLEREFNWEEVTPLRPPSAFSSSLQEEREQARKSNVFVDIRNKKSEKVISNSENNVKANSSDDKTERENVEDETQDNKPEPRQSAQQQNIGRSLLVMKPGSYMTLDRRNKKDFCVESGEILESQKNLESTENNIQETQDNSSRRSSGCSLRSSSSSSEVTHSSPPTIMEGPIMLSHHHVRADSSDSYTSPPTFSRLPPDGHEFPPDYREPANSATSSFHQNFEFDALSRKSSADSTGSLDRSEFLLEKIGSNESRLSRPVMRHDENGVSGVRAKIALFSNGGGGNGSNIQNASSTSLTRSLTHGDVRFEESDSDVTTDLSGVASSLNVQGSSTKNVDLKIAPVASFRSMFNVSASVSSPTSRLGNSKKDSFSSADLIGTSTPLRSPAIAPPRGHIQGRSQSLLEIGSTSFEPVSNKNSNSPKGAASSRGRTRSSVQLTASQSGAVERAPSLLEQRRRSALSKLKGLVIPENNESSTGSSPAIESPKNVLPSPPWKSGNNSTLPKYSPAFKRKPFAVYGTKTSQETISPSKPKPTERLFTEPKKRQSITSPSLHVKSDNDSDNDSAVSSGRSSLSHGSASPPPMPMPSERKNSGQLIKKSEPIEEDVTAESLRILKKDSVEAINRRNIIDSCRTSSGVVVGQVGHVVGQNSVPSSAPIPAFVKTHSNKEFPVLDEVRPSLCKDEKHFKSCPPPPGRPASRSSSFTIAERKKSFEAATSRLTDRHSSQDSLSLKRRGTTDSIFDGFTRRRNSNDSPTSDSSMSSSAVAEKAPLSRADSLASENSYPSTRSGSIVSVIERISYGKPTQNTVEEEKKYPTKQGSGTQAASTSATATTSTPVSETKSKISRFNEESEKVKNESDKIPTTERPKDLPFAPPRKLSGASPSSAVGSKSFKELAERWEKGSGSTVASPQSVFSPQTSFPSPRRSVAEPTPMDAFLSKYGCDSIDGTIVSSSEDWRSFDSNSSSYGAPSFYIPDEATEWESFDPSINNEDDLMKKDPTLVYHQHPLSERKFSVPLYNDDSRGKGKATGNSSSTGNVKMRDKNNAAPSRPSSLIETGGPEMKEMKVFEIGNLGDHGGRHRGGMMGGQSSSHSNSTSRGSSQADLLDCSTTSDTPKSPLPGSSSRELLEVFGKQDNRRCVSVNDIRRAFEKAEQSLSESVKGGAGAVGLGGLFGLSPSHHRMSSLDSTTSDESSIPTPHNCYGSVSSLISGQTNLKDHYGSITSLASSTSLISPQELQGLIDEANQSLEESGTPSHEIMVIVLHREFSAGSIGITLAGGADYESKEITVHKVIPGTLADRDGRIQKGDRVLSINGRSTKGVTHREALSILKAPRAEVVLVLSRSRSVTPATDYCYDRSDYPTYNYINSGRPPKILESPLDSKSLLSDLKFVDAPRGPPFTVILKKEGTGLGFSLEGGKDSPLGDRPLTIKKIFAGGAADKSGKLKVGDEILSVNSTDCTRMTRLEAWNFMKKLSDGYASLIVRQKLDNSRSRDMAPSASSGALSDTSCGNKSDSSLSDNSSSENDTAATTTAASSTGKPTTADLTAEQSLEGTKVEAKR